MERMNPYAHMRKVITLEQALAGKPVADPLTVYDCSLVSDGAAAVLIAPLERALEFTDRARGGRRHRADIRSRGARRKGRHHHLPGGAQAAEKAYRMAGTGPATSNSPKCTTASPSPRSSRIEDLGFVEARAGRAVHVPRAARCVTGPKPVNASGGLKAKGHPVGATGVAQICDVVTQIRGEAGELQLARHEARAGAESGRLAEPRPWSRS